MFNRLLSLLGVRYVFAKRTAGRAGRRVSWYTDRNSYTLEFYLFHFDTFIGVEFADPSVGDEEFMLYLALPFLIKFYFSVRSFPLSQRLPGVDYKGWGTGEREIRFKFHSWALWWSIWTSPNESRDTWREGRINFLDLFFGKLKTLRADGEPMATSIPFPEGSYPCTITPSIITRWRSRFPFWVNHRQVINIAVEGGVPVPGDGENDYDLDDDAIFEHSCTAETLADAYQSFYNSVKRQRGDVDWMPAGGWPAHLITGAL